MRVKVLIITLFFLSLFFFSRNIVDVKASSFAIAPAFKDINFVPNSDYSVVVRVYNHLDSDVSFSVSCKGLLCNDSIFNKTLFVSANGVGYLPIRVVFPTSLNSDFSTLKFYFTPKSTSTSMFSGVLSLPFELRVHNPSFSRAFDYSLFIDRDNKDELKLQVSNLLNKDLNLDFSIFIHELNYSLRKNIIVPSASTRIVFSKKLGQGDYSIKINLVSDSINESRQYDIRIKQPVLKILHLSVGEVKEPNNIFVLNSKLLLSWNKPLKVYPELFIYNKTNEELIREIKLKSFDLNPGVNVFRDYFEFPNNVSVGGYELRFVLFFENQSVEKHIVINNLGNGFFNKRSKRIMEGRIMNVLLSILLIAGLLFFNIYLLIKLLTSRKRVPDKISELISRGNKALDSNNVLLAKQVYHEIELLYKELTDKEKNRYYQDIINLYNRIINFQKAQKKE